MLNIPKGFGLTEMLAGTFLLGASLSVTVPQQMQQEAPKNRAQMAQTDVSALKTALNRWYIENRNWPASVNQLTASGYYSGSVTSPYGTDYQITITPEGAAVITFEAESVRDRSFALSSIRGSQTNANNVNVSVGRPGRDTVQSNFLHRVAVAGRPELNRMETDIDVNNQNINNVNNLTFKDGDFEQLNSTEVSATTATINDRLVFGSSEIINSGNTLTIASQNVDITNNASVGGDLSVAGKTTFVGEVEVKSDLMLGGDLIMSGTDIVGFRTVSGQNLNLTQLLTAANADITNLNVSVGVVDQLTGNSIDYNLGEFLNLYVSEQLNAQTIQTGNINVSGTATLNNLTSNSANISNVSGSTLNYSDLVLGNLTTSGLVAQNGNIRNLDSDHIDSITVQANSGVFGTLSVSGDANVTGELTAQHVTVGQTLSTNSLISNTAQFNNATITTANAHSVTGRTANITTISAKDVNASGAATFGTLNVTNNAAVGGTLSANNLTIQSNVKTNSLNANTANITGLSGNTANYNRVNATNFTGGSYTGSDFSTSVSSVNTNRTLINQYKAQWDSCVAAGGCQ